VAAAAGKRLERASAMHDSSGSGHQLRHGRHIMVIGGGDAHPAGGERPPADLAPRRVAGDDKDGRIAVAQQILDQVPTVEPSTADHDDLPGAHTFWTIPGATVDDTGLMIPHARLHRAVFTAAGLYNIGWGLLAMADPQWPFRLANMDRLNHPQIFMTLGMVLGLYGLLYLEVARRPADGFPVAAVGLAGKVLGPAGWLWLYLSGQWPLASGVIIVTNDLLWWAPFSLYLRDAWTGWRHRWRTAGADARNGD
jgi:hypothetical protein